MDYYIKNGCKKNETYSRLDCYHNRLVKPVLTLQYVSVGFPNNVCVENILLEDQNHRHLINIHEVTDFYNGFLSIFSALKSNTRWTTELMNIDICVENMDDFMGFFHNILLEEFVNYSLIFMRSRYSVGFSQHICTNV